MFTGAPRRQHIHFGFLFSVSIYSFSRKMSFSEDHSFRLYCWAMTNGSGDRSFAEAHRRGICHPFQLLSYINHWKKIIMKRPELRRRLEIRFERERGAQMYERVLELQQASRSGGRPRQVGKCRFYDYFFSDQSEKG
jgi:hypothetical protein